MNPVYTIGHSTRSIEEFIDLLQVYKIKQLVDIRTIPKSRHNPQFEGSNLAESLSRINIEYLHLKELGGLRPAVQPSRNSGWRNKSFRNYADYMQTAEFNLGVQQLVLMANKATTVIMCAEAVPWRCHRSLVGDALLIRQVKVIDIMSHSSNREHTLTSFAVVEGKQITYPGENE